MKRVLIIFDGILVSCCIFHFWYQCFISIFLLHFIFGRRWRWDFKTPQPETWLKGARSFKEIHLDLGSGDGSWIIKKVDKKLGHLGLSKHWVVFNLLWRYYILVIKFVLSWTKALRNPQNHYIALERDYGKVFNILYLASK